MKQELNIDAYRPCPFYFISGTDLDTDLSVEKIDASVAQLKADGFGGFILFNIPETAFSTDEYLGPKWFEMTERFIKAARKYGLQFWFTDGWRCPSGDVGDKIAKIAPQLKQQRLVLKDDGSVEPVAVDWGFPAFEEPESSRLFIELVYKAYEKHLGQYFGNGITGIFSDADNRRFDAYVAGMIQDEYYPWSSNFAESFEEEWGYDIRPYLPEIVGGKHSPQSYDYWCHAERLYLQWFKNNYAWCKKHNLKYTFHTSDTGPFPRAVCRRSSVFTEGNPLTFGRYTDFPGTDHELDALDGGTHFDKRLVQLRVSRGDRYDGPVRTPSFAKTKYDLRAKYTGCAAYLHQKAGGMSELYAVTNWSVTPGELRQIAAWQLLQGVTFFVPHAIHHLFREGLKYGAPPEQHYGTGGSIRQVNDFIAKYAAIASQGKFLPSVLLADVTEDVRAGAQDSENFFEFTDRLNHAGISYTIVPESTPGAIRCLETMPELPPREFTFDGGELLAMRRELADGTRFLMVCNLWSEKELVGNLTFEGRSVRLALAPGEIAVINGPYEEYRTPEEYRRREELQFPAPVAFTEPNRIPFHYNSAFTVSQEIPGGLQLWLPREFCKGATYDGVGLTGGTPVKCFDDEYLSFNVSGKAGKHCFDLPLWRNNPANLGTPHSSTGCIGEDQDPDGKFYLPVYLCGDYDATLDIEKPFDHQVFLSYYILQLWAPRRCDVMLAPRQHMKDKGSWADQGAPFYSGSAVYSFDLDGKSGEAVLEVPDAAVKVEAFLDGEFVGLTNLPPYRMELGDITGKKLLELKVTNTLANQLEEYRAPSGLVKGAALLWKQA